MPKYDWKTLLSKWSQELIEVGEFWYDVPENVLASGWLGYAGATENQIVAAEKRLGVPFPTSYREFLQVSNGWRDINSFIYRFWSAEEVDWFGVRNQDWIDAWVNAFEEDFSAADSIYIPDPEDKFRVEYLQTALEISDVGDSAIVLLNPKVINEDGEWEAWFFANWLPGATIYSSFWDLMNEQHDGFLRLLPESKKEYP